ncbi:MAG: restriction endonuclease subunit S [Christensenellales bacterium]
MNASLNEKLRAVKWGEFKYKEVFNRIEQGRRLKKDDQIDGTIPFVMSGTTNAGVVNYISNPVASFPKNAITIDIFGNTFYRNYAFGAGDDTGVYWNDATAYSSNAMLFFAVAMQKSMMGRFSYGKKLRSSQSEDFTMHLPVTDDGAIDFDFMESFIAELEAERVAELEAERVAELSAYLTVSGLDNYELSSDEENALKNYQSLKWDTYNLEKLFGKSTRGKRLKGDDRIAGTLPFVTAGEASEGISAYISNEVEVFEKNTTTIDMFGSAKYRNYKYGADDHVAVVHTEAVPMKAAIFVTSACHKAAHTGKFDYGHNFYAKDADALYISLPVNEAGNPDYGKMAIIISAIHKLVIKDVVSFTNRKIAGTKEVIAK